jgi:hypothetical protein
MKCTPVEEALVARARKIRGGSEELMHFIVATSAVPDVSPAPARLMTVLYFVEAR